MVWKYLPPTLRTGFLGGSITAVLYIGLLVTDLYGSTPLASLTAIQTAFQYADIPGLALATVPGIVGGVITGVSLTRHDIDQLEFHQYVRLFEVLLVCPFLGLFAVGLGYPFVTTVVQTLATATPAMLSTPVGSVVTALDLPVFMAGVLGFLSFGLLLPLGVGVGYVSGVWAWRWWDG